MAVDIGDIVRVTATIEPGSAARAAFGRTLFVHAGGASFATRADILNLYARDSGVNAYDALADVEAAYGVTHVAYLAAQSYFAQIPFPADLKTAGWFAAGALGHVVGATGQTGATQLAALKALGTVAFVIGGQSVDVDLNQVGTGTVGYMAIATAIQTAIQTITAPDLSAATCTYEAAPGAYRVEVAIGIDIGGPMSGAGSEAVGLAGAGSRYLPGVPVETVGQALTRINTADPGWYWGVPAPSIANDLTDVLAFGIWFEGEEKQAVIDATGDDVLVANETASIAGQLSIRSLSRTSVLWSRTADYKAASAAARFSSVDFRRVDSLITLFGKTLPGRAADNIALTAQVAELTRKRINYYVPVGGTDIVRPGVTLVSGWYMDTRLWLDWMIDRIRRDIFGLLSTLARLPLTQRGAARILSVINTACELGRTNGGIAPGFVSTATQSDIQQTTGNDGFDGYLGRGYLVHVAPISSLTQAQRDAREAPPTTVWLKGSGAINFIDVSLRFSE